MYTIPEIEDKIQALYEYLEANAYDTEGDSWYHGHNPIIISHINNFSATECKKLVSEIRSWKEDILIHLADPFLDISNPDLNGYFLYCQIFLKISDLTSQEYLLGNIHLVNAIPKGSQPLHFYLELEQKITSVNKKLNGNYGFSVEQIKLKINTEKA
ncbi:hypothetical protein BN1195_02979 [Chryseobacterium oranimense G311]|uniref:hypothetical protein n=1 Tax=Chryseobacterium oranimense TaxID=421058 RepID=UPI000533A177|nr:hypothetical protein [Chryseobacterium oranimense]CEJ70651.1 hypothetical protein BN1195_02979 [Chryseobacterium oranimense G311]